MFSYVDAHPLVYWCIVYWNFPSLQCIHIFLQVIKAPQINVAFHVHFYCRKHGCWIASNEYIGLDVDCMSRIAEVHVNSAVLHKLNNVKMKHYFIQSSFEIMNPKTRTTHNRKTNYPSNIAGITTPSPTPGKWQVRYWQQPILHIVIFNSANQPAPSNPLPDLLLG